MAIAYVQSAATQPAGNVNGTSIAATYSGAVTAGNLLVLFVSGISDSSPTAVGDNVNGANAWTIAGSWETTMFRTAIYYFANTTAGTPTVTVTWGTSQGNRSLNIAEYSGIATVSPNDKNADFSTSTPSTTPSSGNVAVPTEDGELFFSGLYCDGDNITVTAGTSLAYTKRRSQDDNFSYSSGIEDAVQTTAAAVDANWTISTAGRYNCAVATFKAAADVSTPRLLWLGLS